MPAWTVNAAMRSPWKNSAPRMRTDARAIFRAGLEAADPFDAVLRHCGVKDRQLRIGERTYELSTLRRLFILGAGKAAAPMARAMEALLASRITTGLISVKYGHTADLTHIDTIEAGHPLPDANGLKAAKKILALANDATADDLVVVLISGGGSALLPLPADGITLEDKQTTMAALLASGATIHEINTLRKQLSAIKGGRLARAAWPARVATLILSDVVGDDPAVIASGPTVADTSSATDGLAIIGKYRLETSLPASVLAHLRAGAAEKKPDAPGPKTGQWDRTDNILVASNRLCLSAAAREAGQRGYKPLILSSMIEGETRTVAGVHCAIAREILNTGQPAAAPACLLSGGGNHRDPGQQPGNRRQKPGIRPGGRACPPWRGPGGCPERRHRRHGRPHGRGRRVRGPADAHAGRSTRPGQPPRAGPSRRLSLFQSPGRSADHRPHPDQRDGFENPAGW